MQTQRIYMSSLAQKLSLLGINVKTLSASNISKTVRIVSPINGLVSKVNVSNFGQILFRPFCIGKSRNRLPYRK